MIRGDRVPGLVIQCVVGAFGDANVAMVVARVVLAVVVVRRVGTGSSQVRAVVVILVGEVSGDEG